jgi:hypothetical protein
VSFISVSLLLLRYVNLHSLYRILLINPSFVVNRTHFKYLYMWLSVYLVGSLVARLAILCDCDPR